MLSFDIQRSANKSVASARVHSDASHNHPKLGRKTVQGLARASTSDNQRNGVVTKDPGSRFAPHFAVWVLSQLFLLCNICGRSRPCNIPSGSEGPDSGIAGSHPEVRKALDQTENDLLFCPSKFTRSSFCFDWLRSATDVACTSLDVC